MKILSKEELFKSIDGFKKDEEDRLFELFVKMLPFFIESITSPEIKEIKEDLQKTYFENLSIIEKNKKNRENITVKFT